jgi:hypothetical protein
MVQRLLYTFMWIESWCHSCTAGNVGIPNYLPPFRYPAICQPGVLLTDTLRTQEMAAVRVTFPIRYFRFSRKADGLDKERSESWERGRKPRRSSLDPHSASCTQFQRWASVGWHKFSSRTDSPRGSLPPQAELTERTSEGKARRCDDGVMFLGQLRAN